MGFQDFLLHPFAQDELAAAIERADAAAAAATAGNGSAPAASGVESALARLEHAAGLEESQAAPPPAEDAALGGASEFERPADPDPAADLLAASGGVPAAAPLDLGRNLHHARESLVSEHDSVLARIQELQAYAAGLESAIGALQALIPEDESAGHADAGPEAPPQG